MHDFYKAPQRNDDICRRVYSWFSLSLSQYECEILATTSSRFEAWLYRNIFTAPMAHEDALKVLTRNTCCQM